MSHCPICNTEYSDGCLQCVDCGADLPNIPVLLTTAMDNQHADIIESQLKAFNIPVMRKYTGIGLHMTLLLGGTRTGIELYVPESELEKAQEIIHPTEETDDGPFAEDEDFQHETIQQKDAAQDPMRGRRIFIRALQISLGVAAFFAVLYAVGLIAAFVRSMN